MAHVNRTEVDESGYARAVVDRRILAKTLGVSVATIRARCKPLGYDKATRCAVYDLERVRADLDAAGVRPWAESGRDRRGRWVSARRGRAESR